MPDEKTNNDRIKNICQILLEMADGNFAYRIPRTKQDDMLETLTVLVNWLAEEMEGSLFHLGFLNPHLSYQYTIQSTFILNANSVITDFSPNIPTLLGIDPSKLMGFHFSQMLEKSSLDAWRTAKNLLLQNETEQTSVILHFTTSQKLTLPAVCTIFWFFEKKKIGVSLFKAVIKNENTISDRNKNESKQDTKIPNKEDLQIIRSVYEYIRMHKNTALPTLGELAKIFGTNEFKLKNGFRHFFNSSIYQFYINERLKGAYMLIKHTALPLNEIAVMSGYNSYPNFSRAFKIKYGCTPNSIDRNTNK